MDTILMFTDIGNYLYVPVYEIPDMKWKDLGKHISNIIKINPEENVICSIPVTNFDTEDSITVFTSGGMIKRTPIKDLKVLRYTKPMPYIKLKEDDKVVSVTDKVGTDVFITTHNGLGLRYDINEVPVLGSRASGVKAIALKNDSVVSGEIINGEEYITFVTIKNTGKRVKLSEFERISRARKGVQVIRDVKTNPYYILDAYVVNNKHNLGLKHKEDIEIIKLTDLPIVDRYSTGSTICKGQLVSTFIECELTNPSVKEEVVEQPKKEISLDSVDQKMMTIDDFLDDFKVGDEN